MKSIQTRLGVLFVLFFLLLSVSVGATLGSLRLQAEDALLVNLAGRQRMLVQMMTRIAAEMQTSPDLVTDLADTAAVFEETLHALQDGGSVVYPSGTNVAVAPVRSRQARRQLGEVERSWNIFRSESDRLIALTPGQGSEVQASLVRLRQYSSALVGEADEMVRLLQEASRGRVQTLLALQVAFFAAALVLLFAGSQYVRSNILVPLEHLGQAAERIGGGDFSTPLAHWRGPTEISLLTRTFEDMREDLQRSHQELEGWAQVLEEKVRDRTKELDVLYRVSREISARLDYQEVLNSVTENAAELLQAESAFLCLLDAGGNVLRLQSLRGGAEAVENLSAPSDNLFIRSVLAQPCEECQVKDCPGSCGIVNRRFTASHLAAPLVVDGRVIGALCVADQRQQAFSQEGQALLNRLTSAAAAAIYNARLYEQAEKLAALEERQRIAAEMHDGLAQMLSALVLQFDQAVNRVEAGNPVSPEILEDARLRLEAASKEVRQVIANLQDDAFSPKTIQQQLAEMVDQAVKENPQVSWQVEIEGSQVMPANDARQLLGIAQEALVNAHRHSEAANIEVKFHDQQGEACLTVADDGRGFDLDAPAGGERQHFGLKIMQARAAALGGTLAIRSKIGEGTTIALSFRLRQPDFQLLWKEKEHR